MPFVYGARRARGGKKLMRVTKSEARQLRASGMRTYGNKRSMALAVKRIVRGQAETKYVADNYDKNQVHDLPTVWTINDLGAGVLRFLPMIPRVQQGTDTNERVGDSVSPSGSLKTTLNFAYNDTDVSGHQIKVEVWYGTCKSRKSWEGQNPLSTANFLDVGDGTNTSPGTVRERTLYPTDKKLVTFKKRTFILSKTAQTTGGDNGDGNFAANAGKSFRAITLYHKPPKKLKYVDGGDEYPSNYAPGYFINLSYANGSQPLNQVTLDKLVNVSSRTHMWFKDM